MFADKKINFSRKKETDNLSCVVLNSHLTEHFKVTPPILANQYEFVDKYSIVYQFLTDNRDNDELRDIIDGILKSYRSYLSFTIHITKSYTGSESKTFSSLH